MNISIRPLQPDEVPTFLEAFGIPLGIDLSPPFVERFTKVVDLGRLKVAVEGNEVVGTFGSHLLDLTVPGERLPMAGTSLVAVLPTHRRRGILRRLLTQHLCDAHEQREPLAGLWASEGNIYGRFGYGIATERLFWRIPKSHAVFREPVEIADAMRLISRDEALAVLPNIHEAMVPDRPGVFRRRMSWWQHRILADPPIAHPADGAQRRVVYAPGGIPRGYALYRTRRRDTESLLDVAVAEVIAQDARAEKAMWQFLFGVDLVQSIEAWNLAVDHRLRWWLSDVRKVERHVHDAMWVRIVDAERALSARRYRCAGHLVIRLHDALCPWNDATFRLTASEDGTATCQRTFEPCQLECEIDALGSVYLGGVLWSDLADAGRVSGSRQTLTTADVMFGWHCQPWCAERF